MAEKRHIFEVWASEQLGKPAELITISDASFGLTRRGDLKPAPFGDSRGGRVRHRLRPWPDAERAAELATRAQHFIDETPDEPVGEPAAGTPADAPDDER